MSGAPAGAILEADGLSVRRGARLVVDSVSLALGAGEAVALIGPNAAGKSTLVRALAGLLAPAAGQVRLRGRSLRDCPRDGVARAIALVAPDEAAPATITVAERARLGRYPYRGALRPFTAEDDAAVARALARAGVQHLFSLSGNHVMPVYDAALDANLPIVHTRHEGAAMSAWRISWNEPVPSSLSGAWPERKTSGDSEASAV